MECVGVLLWASSHRVRVAAVELVENDAHSAFQSVCGEGLAHFSAYNIFYLAWAALPLSQQPLPQ